MKISPHNTSAERVLLAGLLREPEIVGAVCIEKGVTVEDFYHHHHRLLWSVVWELIGTGCDVTLAAVYVVLRANNELRELPSHCPALWLIELFDADPTGAWCYIACRILRREALRRQVIYRAMEMQRDAFDGVLATEEYERQLERTI